MLGLGLAGLTGLAREGVDVHRCPLGSRDGDGVRRTVGEFHRARDRPLGGHEAPADGEGVVRDHPPNHPLEGIPLRQGVVADRLEGCDLGRLHCDHRRGCLLLHVLRLGCHCRFS